MATQFSDLQKLLINVAEGKCDAFIKAHINAGWNGTESELPDFTAGETDKYYDKVVFLKKYNTIYTKGTFFGNTWDLQNSISANGITVKYDPTQNKIVTTVDAATYSNNTWTNADNVVTGSTVKTYVDEKVAGAVAEATAAMEFKTSISSAEELSSTQGIANNGDVYVVGDGFEADGKKFEAGDLIIFQKESKESANATYIVVERNLDDAIVKDTVFTQNEIVVVSSTDSNTSTHKVQTTGYKIGGNTFAATGSYVATEAGVKAYISSAINAIDHSNGTGNGTYMTYAYHTANGITYIDSIDPKLAIYMVDTYGNLSTREHGLVDSIALSAVITYYDNKFGALDMDHSITTLTEVNNDYLKVSDSSADDSNDHNYTVELNVVNLSDVVGMTYDETTGKWVAPEGSSLKNGLANAADVANELVNDEKVIAAALNDHEARIDTLEDFVGDIDNTIQTQLEIGEVTVNGLIATKTKGGLVNADLLVSVINALDPWEEYTGEESTGEE